VQRPHGLAVDGWSMVDPEELKLNGDDCLASLEVSAEAAGVDSACRVVFSPDGLVFVYFFSGLECVWRI